MALVWPDVVASHSQPGEAALQLHLVLQWPQWDLSDTILKGKSLRSSDSNPDRVMAGLKHALNSKQRAATCRDEDAALASFGGQIQAEGPVPSVNSCIHYHTCATFL